MAADYNSDNRDNHSRFDNYAGRGQDTRENRYDDRRPASRPREGYNSRGQKTGVYIGADTFGIFLDSKTRNQFRGKQDKMRRDAREDRFGDWYADPNRYHRFKRSSWHRRDCFPVSRHAYDQRGRRVKVGATMCYTRDGRTYIAEGSRRIYR